MAIVAVGGGSDGGFGATEGLDARSWSESRTLKLA